MSTTSKETKCDTCLDTGLVRASLVKNEEENTKHISVVICGKHYNHAMTEKTVIGMQAASGLHVDIAGVEK